MNYSKRYKELAITLLEDHINIGIVILKGIKDPIKWKRYSFKYFKDNDYSFNKVKGFNKVAYIEIDRLNLFRSRYKEAE